MSERAMREALRRDAEKLAGMGVPPKPCPLCDGTGIDMEDYSRSHDAASHTFEPCEACDGNGTYF